MHHRIDDHAAAMKAIVDSSSGRANRKSNAMPAAAHPAAVVVGRGS